MPPRIRLQILLTATVIVASVAVTAAAVSATGNNSGVAKGDRLDWAPTNGSTAFEVINTEPGLTVIARGF